MSKYPKHGKEYFFKYAKIETAKIILKSQKFRYSSPITFNDPFDIQTELFFDFDISDLPERVTNEVHKLVIGSRVADLSGDSEWVKANRLLQEKHKEGLYRKEHLDILVKPLIEHLTKVFEDSRIQYNDHWKNMLKQIKVFCVSEINSSILMWSHYAADHTGVCFKLKVFPEEDNSICTAQRVSYLPSPPPFFELEQWIDSIVLSHEIDFNELYYRYPLSKSDIWEYEREWRVWAPFEDNGSNHLDVPIKSGEIEAIYFGVNSDPKLINEIVSISKEQGVNKFFVASKAITKYDIDFHER